MKQKFQRVVLGLMLISATAQSVPLNSEEEKCLKTLPMSFIAKEVFLKPLLYFYAAHWMGVFSSTPDETLLFGDTFYRHFIHKAFRTQVLTDSFPFSLSFHYDSDEADPFWKEEA